MKKICLSMFVVISLISASVNATNAIHVVKTGGELKWMDMPHSMGKYAVLAGDPKKKGLFVVRIKFPADYTIAPHHHEHNEYDTVITGSCYIARGSVFKKENGLKATAGAFVSIPGGLSHYGWTDTEGAVIQISGMGPWKPIY